MVYAETKTRGGERKIIMIYELLRILRLQLLLSRYLGPYPARSEWLSAANDEVNEGDGQVV
jgi:hypothetical protein